MSGALSRQQGTEVDPAHPGKMGSKQIAQETFDDAVQENITEFEMDPEEAVREAVLQFESQGIARFAAGVLQIREVKRILRAKVDRAALEGSICEVEQRHH